MAVTYEEEDIRSALAEMRNGSNSLVFGYPATVLLDVEGRATPEELTEIAKKRHALDPSIFETNPPFFWTAEISSDRQDSYYTRMSPKSSLPNYAKDAEEGRSFQNSHNSYSLPLGKSLTGRFVRGSGNGVARVLADFYTVRGLRLGEVDTDNFINGVRAGIVKDVSIGFSPGEYICSICAKDMLRDWSCWHIPGYKYKKAAEGEQPSYRPDPKGELCWASVENARLNEVSAVYDGATPGAQILKAYAEAEAGRMPAEVAERIQSHYRIRLPSARRFIAGATLGRGLLSPAGEKSMPGNNELELIGQIGEIDMSAFLAPVRAALAGAGVPTKEMEDPVAGVVWLASERARLLPFQAQAATLDRTVRTQNEELEQLRPLSAEVLELRGLKDEVVQLRALKERVPALEAQAQDGKKYRENLIKEALEEGTRAVGKEFALDTYRLMLEQPGTSIDLIVRMRDDWRTQGDARFGPGGRRTVDGGGDGDGKGDEGGEEQPNGRESEAKSPFTPVPGSVPRAAFRS